MEKYNIRKYLQIKCLLSNIFINILTIVGFSLFVRIKEMRENETKREKKERVTRDSDKSSK